MLEVVTVLASTLCLSVFYVLSLYVRWEEIFICVSSKLTRTSTSNSRAFKKENEVRDRDHHYTILSRFLSATLMAVVVCPIWVLSFAETSLVSKADRIVMGGSNASHDVSSMYHSFNVYLTLVGLRFDGGTFQAILYPMILTVILFMGPISSSFMFNRYQFHLMQLPQYWRSSLTDLIWIRNHIVAPISEELVFRACLIPILVDQFSLKCSVLICPLFFGVAHLHHFFGRVVHYEMSWRDAALISAFQAAYTTIFGVYCAYLHVKTGHLLASISVHAFCNWMGFPNFALMLKSSDLRIRTLLVGGHLLGLLLFIYLFFPLTNSAHFNNQLFTSAL